jgi:hypothetical protein
MLSKHFPGYDYTAQKGRLSIVQNIIFGHCFVDFHVSGSAGSRDGSGGCLRDGPLCYQRLAMGGAFRKRRSKRHVLQRLDVERSHQFPIERLRWHWHDCASRKTIGSQLEQRELGVLCHSLRRILSSSRGPYYEREFWFDWGLWRGVGGRGPGGVFSSLSTGTGIGVYGTEIGASNTGYAVQAVNNSASGWGVYSSGTSPNYFAGNVGIGTTSPSAALEVVGDIKYSGLLTDTSDRRLKDNIKPLGPQLGRITSLQPVSFTMKADKERRTEFGLIAQDAEPIYPNLVVTAPDGTKSLAYSGLIAPLIEAAKEEQAEINQLRAGLAVVFLGGLFFLWRSRAK